MYPRAVCVCVFESVSVLCSLFLPLISISISPSLHGLVAQSCPTLWDTKDHSPPDSSVHGILHARILKRVAISLEGGSSWPRDWTRVFCIAGRFFSIWATRETHLSIHYLPTCPSIIHHFIYHHLCVYLSISVNHLYAYNHLPSIYIPNLEKEMVAHSTILAWTIPWTQESGEYQSIGSQRVRYDWATNMSLMFHAGNNVYMYICCCCCC